MTARKRAEDSIGGKDGRKYGRCLVGARCQSRAACISPALNTSRARQTACTRTGIIRPPWEPGCQPSLQSPHQRLIGGFIILLSPGHSELGALSCPTKKNLQTCFLPARSGEKRQQRMDGEFKTSDRRAVASVPVVVPARNQARKRTVNNHCWTLVGASIQPCPRLVAPAILPARL